jgi:prepilin-type N-terminal cleavage/methylation domain-containing protein/prepilin-type processing-associated H-X9-DG protein
MNWKRILAYLRVGCTSEPGRTRELRESSRGGFTLIELLVVLAVIGLIAALLLPALSRGKAAAKSAACKSNLRQLGIALEMYVSDYEKYPGNGALYSGPYLVAMWGTGMNWLKPYLGERQGPNDRFYSFGTQLNVFHCPARPPDHLAGFFNQPGVDLYPLGYGYNELGTGWRSPSLHLGLGFVVQLPEFGWQNVAGPPPGRRSYVTPAYIAAPSRTMSMGDGGGAGWLTPNFPGDGGSTLQGPHAQKRANVLFCDSHVENAKDQTWNEPTESARARWNNDNLPHPETWR